MESLQWYPMANCTVAEGRLAVEKLANGELSDIVAAWEREASVLSYIERGSHNDK